MPERLPTLRLFLRSEGELASLAERAKAGLARVVGDRFDVAAVPCDGQIGSGALPLASLPSGVALKPRARRGQGRALGALATALRRLPAPVIGRTETGRLVLDVRCLEDPERFLAQLLELLTRHGPGRADDVEAQMLAARSLADGGDWPALPKPSSLHL